MALPLDIQRQLEDFSGSGIKLVSACAGGSISSAFSVLFEDDSAVFLKYLESAPVGFYQAEAAGLRALALCDVVRVPEVLLVSEPGEHTRVPFIVLEYLEAGRQTRDSEEVLGRSLAGLHSCSSTQFGFSSDNFIGLLPQRNNTEDVSKKDLTWAEFFYSYRLLPQVLLGEKKGWFSDSLSASFSALEPRIETLLSGAEARPVLVHGDLWLGNIYWSADGPALIDPAVYYGDREVDLAFMELFSSPSEYFLAAYEEIAPLAVGYRERKDLLNLYHLLNHANLFGGSYIREVSSLLKKL